MRSTVTRRRASTQREGPRARGVCEHARALERRTPQGSNPIPSHITAGDGTDIHYRYDAAQRRVLMTLGTGEQRIYAGSGYERQTTTDAAGAVTRHEYKVFAAGRQVAQVERETRSGVTVPTATRYLHQDRMGSSQVITDEQGRLVHVQRFDAWGKAITPASDSSDGATKQIRAGYTGHETDVETGLVNMKGRIYDARLGRFLQADPIVRPSSQGLNRYSYVLNNPFAYTDPSGLYGESVDDGTVTNMEDPDEVIWDPTCQGPGCDDASSSDSNPDDEAEKSINAPSESDTASQPDEPTADQQNDDIDEPGTEAGSEDADARPSANQSDPDEAREERSQEIRNAPHNRGVFQNLPGGTPETREPMMQRELVTYGVTGVTAGGGAILAATAVAISSPELVVGGGLATGGLSTGEVGVGVGGGLGAGAAAAAENGAAESATRGVGCPGCPCFVPGTLVELADGSTKAIEDVKEGDWVLADNPLDDEPPEPFRVIARHENFAEHLVSITVVNDEGKTGVIDATGQHPFWTTTHGWVAASELRAGDSLLSDAGKPVRVAQVVEKSQEITTYNLSVEGIPTFFVVTNGVSVLVHNQPAIHAPAPDWGVKFAHVSARNGVEVSIRGGGDVPVLEPVFPGQLRTRAGREAYREAVREVEEALQDPAWRTDLLNTARRATKMLGKGTKLERAASGATRALEVTLERMACP